VKQVFFKVFYGPNSGP